MHDDLKEQVREIGKRIAETPECVLEIRQNYNGHGFGMETELLYREMPVWNQIGIVKQKNKKLLLLEDL